MSRRTPLALLGAGAIAAAALVAGPATAQDAPRKNATIKVVGGYSVKPGKSFTDNQRFSPLSRAIRSGGTLTILNKAKSEDPHTLTVVRKSQVPKTVAQGMKCFQGGACAQADQAHTEGNHDGPPKNPVVNTGTEGLDQPGDSVVFMKEPTKIEVSAPKGTNLHFICAIHPHMQGVLRVR